MKKENWKIFYPLLFGIYPALGLVAFNITQITLMAGLRSILLSLVLILGVYAILCWRVQDVDRAALLCGWFCIFFFAYGHVYNTLNGWMAFGIILGRQLFLLPLWLIVFGVGAWLILTKAKRLHLVSQALNIMSVILVLLPAITITRMEWERNQTGHPQQGNIKLASPSGLTTAAQYPDVYYIILDGYTRGDMLLREYDLDISGFIGQLEEIGFYIPPCAQSNYAITALSLASSLNMNYLDQVIPQTHIEPDNWIPFSEPIRHSQVRKIFSSMGYKTVAFGSTDWWWTQIPDADYSFMPTSSNVGTLIDFSNISQFEVFFLKTTILRSLEGSSDVIVAKKILITLDELENVPSLPGPKFVFVHLQAPHDPYVFNPQGDIVITKSENPGFPNEIQYLNKRIVPLVQAIINRSTVPPIIILQADHGWDLDARMANFNALYFPNGGNKKLYPTLTPVNTFRLVFDTYFGQEFPLLPDISYYSANEDPLSFTKVQYPCKP
jgi:Sulfatase